jgi:hypothetical protein
VSIGVGVLCERARENDYHHDDDDQYLSGHHHYAGQNLLLYNEWPNGRSATLGTPAKVIWHLFLGRPRRFVAENIPELSEKELLSRQSLA